jgi:hypothetical protein
MNFGNELVITATEEPKPIRGGVELTIVSYILSLPTKSMEVHVVVINTQVKKLEEHVTPKPIPLDIPKIGVGVGVTFIDTITHAFEVFRTPNTILKDTLITERPRLVY